MKGFLNLIPDLIFMGAFGADWLGRILIALLSFALGFSLNRGSICTVIPTADLVARKRPARSIVLLEAAVWAGLVYAVLNMSPFMPEGWLPLGYLVVGTASFAVGSYVNGTCVFGSVGYFGNGEIEFALVFVGIFIVKYIEPLTNLLPAQPPLSMPLQGGALPLVGILAALLLGRFFLTRPEEKGFGIVGVTMAAAGITFALLVTLSPLFSITASIETILSVSQAHHGRCKRCGDPQSHNRERNRRVSTLVLHRARLKQKVRWQRHGPRSTLSTKRRNIIGGEHDASSCQSRCH